MATQGKQIYQESEKNITKAFEDNFFKLVTQTQKYNFKTFLNVLVCCLVLILGGVGATLYVWNYHDGKQIAEQRAELALREREQEIRNQAIKEYQESDQFVKDGATYVANNFFQLRILEIFYQEMPIKEKKELKLYDWLNKCHQEYKETIGNK